MGRIVAEVSRENGAAHDEHVGQVPALEVLVYRRFCWVSAHAAGADLVIVPGRDQVRAVLIDGGPSLIHDGGHLFLQEGAGIDLVVVAATRPTAPMLTAFTASAPAATRTRKNVPNTSNNLRISSWGLSKSLPLISRCRSILCRNSEWLASSGIAYFFMIDSTQKIAFNFAI